MGAQSFKHVVDSSNIVKAIEGMKEDARERYGSDYYNGTISNCDYINRPIKIAEKFSETSRKKGEKHIEATLGGCRKGDIYIVDLGVINYQVVTIKKINTQGAPKYEQEYGVTTWHEYVFEEKAPKKFFPKSEKKKATEYAMKKTLETGEEHMVVLLPRLVSGKDVVCKTKVETKTYKSRPKLKPMPNRCIKEIHRYIVYGWAPC